MTYFLFILGFGLLFGGADILVKGASALARRFHVSDLAVGLTVVAFGTSTPELTVNIISSIQGNTDIAIGNILGSNTANILLILGISAVIRPLTVTSGTVWKEIPFSVLAALAVAFMANDVLFDSQAIPVISRSDGLGLLLFFAIFLYYVVCTASRIEGMEDHVPSKSLGLPASLCFTAGGLLALIVGARLSVEGAVLIAADLGLSESLVGLTIVAVGTSLPELATSAMAAYRGNSEIAVGNIVGSNIFNIFFILGTSAVIRPLPFYDQGNRDIIAVLLSSLLLFGFMFTWGKKLIDRREGGLLLLLYFLYMLYCFYVG
ncbi:MAG: calcium/sodium antiporter [Deltaproteobacteria bacterium]|nr:calcium/sodium antiporter [Deltaproteobacteria bacterium]